MSNNKVKPTTGSDFGSGLRAERIIIMPTNNVPHNEQNVKCNISSIVSKSKPEGAEIGRVVNDTKRPERIFEVTIDQLANCICAGHTFSPAMMNGTAAADWVQQQVLVVDFDNQNQGQPTKDPRHPSGFMPDQTELLPDEALDICDSRGIPPNIAYYTFNHLQVCPKKNPKGWSRYRFVWFLNEPVTDSKEIEQIIAGLFSLFPRQVDASVDTLERIIFGTDKGLIAPVTHQTIDKQILLDAYHERVQPDTEQPAIGYNPGNMDSDPLMDFPGEFDLREWIAKYGIRVTKELPYNGGTKFQLAECLFNPDHKSPDSALFLGADGKIGYKCLHNSCYGRRWQDVRVLFEPDAYNVPAKKLESAKKRVKQEVAKQVTGVVYNKEDLPQDLLLDNIPWIYQETDKNGKVKTKVLCPVLADHIRENVRYIFVRDEVRAETMRFIYTKGYYKQVSDSDMQGYIKALIPSQYHVVADIREVQNLLYTDLRTVSHEALNPERYINFQNGLLDLDTRQLIDHTPDVLCTVQIPCPYVPNAPTPPTRHFDRFIEHLSSDGNGTRREDTERLILEFMGVTISNVAGYRMKKAMFMVGDGNTGKSVCKELLVKLIGANNSSGVDLSDIEARFGGSQIFNKRLVGSNDMSWATVKELKVFKRATGGDSLWAEYKGGDGFNFYFNGVMWFCCNTLPQFGGDKGDWVYDRIAVVRCDNPVPVRDKLLKEKLYGEREYIISKAVDALYGVIDNDYEYHIPLTSIIENEQYKVDNNSFLQFMEECTVERDNFRIADQCTTKRFHDVYVAWCRDNNNGYSEPIRAIRPMLDKMGKGHQKKVNGAYYYDSFTLSQEVKTAYSKAYDCWQEIGHNAY